VTWATVLLPVRLNAGGDTVTVTATGAGGAPNLDYLEVS
jgi:hypothetical protein